MKVAIVLEKNVTQILDVENEEAVQELMKKFPVVVELSEYDPEPKIGWEWNGSKLFDPSGLLTASLKITRLAFRNRFTQTERATLYGLAAQNNATGYAFRDYLDSVNAATFIDLSRADTKASVNLLATMGVLSAQRASDILTKPIEDQEKYKGE
jgi:hypothetical protein